MDKSVFTKNSFEEAADHKKIYDLLSATEQTAAFNTLMAAAFGFVGQAWPKMDKTIFSTRKQYNGTKK